MVFSSHLFIFWFLPLTLIFYYFLKKRWRNGWLTLVSYLFYGWANPLFVLLMFLSTCIDYFCGLVLMGFPKKGITPPLLIRGGERTKKQKWAVALSVIANLSLLSFFKYANFGIENWNALIHQFLSDDSWLLPSLHIVLPLGISFYTFQSMSYAIDVYRGDARGITSFVDFACYVSMYPQLVAGPIIRFQEVAKQLRDREHTLDKFARGITFFVLGAAQKILLANPAGMVADWSFDTPDRLPLDAWFGLIAYSFQIFFDFAGYSNMAIGLGLMIGFTFPKNFDFPYKSLSITEFWRRWHISLSSWLRDYLYIPLGGNRKGTGRTYINLMLVMLLGGLWHGASWNFLIWGAIHGCFLVTERWFKEKQLLPIKFPVYIKWGYTYLVVIIAWVFFRAPSLSAATDYLSSLMGCNRVAETSQMISSILYTPYHLLSLTVGAVVVALAPGAYRWTRELTTSKWIILLLLFIISIMALTTQSYNPFIYFIF